MRRFFNPDPLYWTNDMNSIYGLEQSLSIHFTADAACKLGAKEFSAAVHGGGHQCRVVIPGFTDGYIGSAPDLGAYEYGALPWTAGVGSRPTLVISGAGGGALTLTASPDAAFYALYCATNLTPPVVWRPVPNATYVSGIEWSVMVDTASNASSYYRLQSPQ